ncbi:MAG: hypothetical protein Q6L58_06475 [Thermostichales cyanobacterium BF3_bins_165]
MNGVEQIQDQEFQDILGIPLRDGVGLYDVWERFFQGRRQQRLLLIAGVALGILVAGSLVWILVSRQSSLWYGVPGVGIVLLLLVGWRLQLLRKSGQTHLGILSPGGFDRASQALAAAVSALSTQVHRYNELVGQLQDSKTGISWREFRKLTDEQRLYIQSSFLRVRGKILGSLRVCRQQIDHPEQPIGSWDKEIISRDLEMKFRFAFNTMTSDYYLGILKSLEEVEAEVRQVIEGLSPAAGSVETAKAAKVSKA